ncbi:MAG: glycine--tRNA ligase subunit beta [Alphaproteobacteria bacterium]|nr:glycine--tRNA ligase subunit beta [Alphaproteobacteria bacterium]
MPELFLELFSEEIPARMQARAAEDLSRLAGEALAPLNPAAIRTFHGPRRIALAAEVAPRLSGSTSVERGPRASAPEQALAGFLRKHGANRDQLRVEGEYWVLDKSSAAIGAAELIADAMPPLLRRFPWPKSMRWGGSSAFTWVRPLRRIVCLLDHEVVRFDLRDGDDDGHGLASGDLTEGHRFLSPGAFPVISCADWRDKLRAHHVLVEAAERKRVIAERIAALAAEKGLTVADDPGLLDEVAGLVEWPVPLLGRIDAGHMDLPAEVMQVSMRVNQRYFALRTATGEAAPFFAFVANVEAEDGGAAIIAGNERVLRARFADARHFWDLDRRTRLEARIPLLDQITFHAKLGSQGERVVRLARLAAIIAPQVGAGEALAERAAHLAKADLVSGMVGEFPELQGVMGRYYALHDGEPPEVADAIRDHYAPRGPSEGAPASPVSIAVALADKLDLLAGFFAIGEKPTGSGDPYALRRAALGIIRIIRENGLRLSLLPILTTALDPIRSDIEAALRRAQQDAARSAGVPLGPTARGNLTTPGRIPGSTETADADGLAVIGFITDRMQVHLRAEGARHDVLAAAFAARWDDDINRLLARTEAVAGLLGSENGKNLLTAYRRAANILRIEDRKDGPHEGPADPAEYRIPEEHDLALALGHVASHIDEMLQAEDFSGAMTAMAALRHPLDAFFDKVTVNAPEPHLRRNRLRLLAGVRAMMDRVADFSLIEG